MIQPRIAYDKAKLMSEEYVMDEAFRISFLRAEEFDADKAALRMCRHFETKSNLFGDDKLVRTITQADLPDDARQFLQEGSIQLLGSRDSLGRIVLAVIPSILTSRYLGDSYVHFHWYFLQCVSADEETQKRGLCYISYALNSKIEDNEENRKVWFGVSMNQKSSSLRVSSFHHCYESRIGPMIGVITHLATVFTRVRIRQHQGSVANEMLRIFLFVYFVP